MHGLTWLTCLLLAVQLWGTAKFDFWSRQRKGANFFNQTPTRDRFEAGRAMGLQVIRLAADKWQASDRDFLIGNADHYQGISEQDFAKLRAALDQAHALELKVVLTMLSLPGARWKQNNDQREDPRLWQHEHYQVQAREFWRDLAGRLRTHPAIVGYDPLNEPHPGRALAGLEAVEGEAYAKWWAESRGTPADLNRFNRLMVAAIREVDPETPILLEGPAYASPAAFPLLEPVDDRAVLYSFHLYEPWNYTTRRVNQGRYAYPQRMPGGESDGTQAWTSENLEEMVRPVVTWSRRHGIPPTRIMVAEFGCSRRVAGAREYLADLIKIFNRQQWHWAFYSYREDTWTEMDYELGDGPLGEEYWAAVEAGRNPPKPRRNNPLFEVLRREFQR